MTTSPNTSNMKRNSILEQSQIENSSGKKQLSQKFNLISLSRNNENPLKLKLSMTSSIHSPSIFDDTDSESINKNYVKALEEKVRKMDAEIGFLKTENSLFEQKSVL